MGDIVRAALDRVEKPLAEKCAGRVSLLVLTAQGEFGFGASWHPNRKQSQRNAAELTAYLSTFMGWRMGRALSRSRFRHGHRLVERCVCILFTYSLSPVLFGNDF